MKKGQSLIEVLVAFAVSVLIGVALITASLAAQKTALGARNQSQATKLLQEYVEQTRAIRDANGYGGSGLQVPGVSPSCYTLSTPDLTNPAGWSMSSFACPASATTLSASANQVPITNGATFYRWITITTIDSLKEKVAVDVSWAEGGNVRNVHSETIFSAWCPGNITGVSDPAKCQ